MRGERGERGEKFEIQTLKVELESQSSLIQPGSCDHMQDALTEAWWLYNGVLLSFRRESV